MIGCLMGSHYYECFLKCLKCTRHGFVVLVGFQSAFRCLSVPPQALAGKQVFDATGPQSKYLLRVSIYLDCKFSRTGAVFHPVSTSGILA